MILSANVLKKTTQHKRCYYHPYMTIKIKKLALRVTQPTIVTHRANYQPKLIIKRTRL
jgi:hypothetical protein